MRKQLVLYIFWGLFILYINLSAGCHKDGLTNQQQAELMSQQSRESHELMMAMMTNHSEKNNLQEIVTLEGMLKTHPKFLYNYYIAAYGGQTCALYGNNNPQEFAKLEDITPDTFIRVRGCLGTMLHKGGTEDNPSPFGRTWVIYMEVKEINILDQSEI